MTPHYYVPHNSRFSPTNVHTALHHNHCTVYDTRHKQTIDKNYYQI